MPRCPPRLNPSRAGPGAGGGGQRGGGTTGAAAELSLGCASAPASGNQVPPRFQRLPPGTPPSLFSGAEQLSTAQASGCAGGAGGDTPEPPSGWAGPTGATAILPRTDSAFAPPPTHTHPPQERAAMRPYSSRPPLSPCRPALPTRPPHTHTRRHQGLPGGPSVPKGLFWE